MSEQFRVAQCLAIEASKRDWQMLIVGGFVRDHVIGKASKDVDMEVYGDYSVAGLVEFLSQFGPVDAVGAQFGVLKVCVDGVDLDVSVPRRENKIGRGKRGFIVEPDPSMTPTEAASRRDFTMNSMFMNPLTRQVFDPFGGIDHLRKGLLVATGPAFSEDPTRVRRGAQFCGRFDLEADDRTLRMSRSLLPEAHSIHHEMVWIEWEKLLRQSVRPSRGLRFLKDCGWLKMHPELEALVGCEQEHSHHPEGDTFEHTCESVDAMIIICDREEEFGEDRVVLGLAMLLHDVGKAVTSEFSREKNRITSYGHDIAGGPIVQKFMASIGTPRCLRASVLALVTTHMRHVNFCIGGGISDRTVRRLAEDLRPATIREWSLVVEADNRGRGSMSDGLPRSAIEILERAQVLALRDAAPKPVLMGRHLLELGMAPGPVFGKMLRRAFQAQLDGAFEDAAGGIAWLGLGD